MAEFELYREEPDEAIRLIKAAERFGGLESVTIRGDVDVGELLETAAGGEHEHAGLGPLGPLVGGDEGQGGGVSQEPAEREGVGGPNENKGVRHVDYVGQRKEQVTGFLEDNEGEWVDWKDFVDEVAIDAPSETTEMGIATDALRNAYNDGYIEPIERRYIAAGENGGRRAQYRYGEPEGEEPGTVKKGTNQHEALALLTHLCNKERERQTVPDLAGVGRLSNQQFSNALNDLKKKGLAAHRAADERGEAGTWAPTEDGLAELDRLGGFQLNS